MGKIRVSMNNREVMVKMVALVIRVAIVHMAAGVKMVALVGMANMMAMLTVEVNALPARSCCKGCNGGPLPPQK